MFILRNKVTNSSSNSNNNLNSTAIYLVRTLRGRGGGGVPKTSHRKRRKSKCDICVYKNKLKYDGYTMEIYIQPPQRDCKIII